MFFNGELVMALFAKHVCISAAWNAFISVPGKGDMQSIA
jgi:hypothetical protein